MSGTATVTRDRALIHELYGKDWKAWVGDEGGERDGGPDDPRLALILVDVESVVYLEVEKPQPVATPPPLRRTGRRTGSPPGPGCRRRGMP